MTVTATAKRRRRQARFIKGRKQTKSQRLDMALANMRKKAK